MIALCVGTLMFTPMVAGGYCVYLSLKVCGDA